jgi:hypothetical protein
LECLIWLAFVDMRNLNFDEKFHDEWSLKSFYGVKQEISNLMNFQIQNVRKLLFSFFFTLLNLLVKKHNSSLDCHNQKLLNFSQTIFYVEFTGAFETILLWRQVRTQFLASTQL